MGVYAIPYRYKTMNEKQLKKLIDDLERLVVSIVEEDLPNIELRLRRIEALLNLPELKPPEHDIVIHYR